MYSGVPPLSAALLTSAPASLSTRTIASWPFRAPVISGIPPSSFSLLTSAANSISARTIASWPF